MFNAIDGEASTDGQALRIPETLSSHGCVQHISPPSAGEPSNEERDNSDSETAIVQSLLSPSRDHHYSPPHSAPLGRPLEMEQILTEDGEPMLNPGTSFLSYFLSPY